MSDSQSEVKCCVTDFVEKYYELWTQTGSKIK